MATGSQLPVQDILLHNQDFTGCSRVDLKTVSENNVL